MSTLGNRAYVELRRMLVQGELAPGARLVNRKLADDIGLSMTPIREAINKLASEGLIDQVPGSGAFVRTISLADLDDLYKIRMALEPMAAAKAALRATPREIVELRALVTASRGIVRRLADSRARHASAALNTRWITIDRNIHELIFRASRNPWLAKVSGEMHLLSFSFSRQQALPALLTAEGAEQTWKSHRQLVQAIASRDAKRAANVMRDHIRVGARHVLGRQSASPGRASRVSAARPAVRR
jgi:DNA-binding GntR family transcriptional regulator